MRQFGPFVPLVVVFVLLLVGCELMPTKTVVRYRPSDPDTVIVRDTVVVDDEDDDDRPWWRGR